MANEDPLDSLFIKGDEVNRELLKDILSRYVRLDENGRIFPLAIFYSQTNKNKIIIALLARKALTLKTGAEESISPNELGKLIDIADGSLRPALRMLVEEHLVDDENSHYKVFSHALQRCAELLSQKQENMSQSKSIKRSKINSTRISMRAVIEDLINQGGLDEGKTAREIYEMVLQRRPGTLLNPMYKVVLDMVHEQKIFRETKEDIWIYRRALQVKK